MQNSTDFNSAGFDFKDDMIFADYRGAFVLAPMRPLGKAIGAIRNIDELGSNFQDKRNRAGWVFLGNIGRN